MTVTFKVKLGSAYYKQGFFNVSVSYQQYFANDGDSLEIICDGKHFDGYINRRCNNTYAPRVFGSTVLRDWFQKNFKQGDDVLVKVDCKERIYLSKS